MGTTWHVTLPGELRPRLVSGDKLMVWGPEEYNGAGAGFATATPGPDGLVVALDDSQLTDRCRADRHHDPYAPDHSHRLNVTQGACPYAKPILAKTGQGYDLIGIELAGMDFEDGNVVEWQPGARPVVTFPPKPEVDLTPIPGLW